MFINAVTIGRFLTYERNTSDKVAKVQTGWWFYSWRYENSIAFTDGFL